jgi:hypothetical protein
MDWLGVYNLTRLALLACTLVTAARWLLAESRRGRLEAPALRMLSDDGLPPDSAR